VESRDHKPIRFLKCAHYVLKMLVLLQFLNSCILSGYDQKMCYLSFFFFVYSGYCDFFRIVLYLEVLSVLLVSSIWLLK
jgi:hypothetical protein